MTQHTPGPWAVRGGNAELPQVWDSAFDVCVTDRVFNGNADLIASAPELLSACEQMLHACDPDNDPAFDWVREVVSKAKGGA